MTDPLKILVLGTPGARSVLIMAAILEAYPDAVFVSEQEYEDRRIPATLLGFGEMTTMPKTVANQHWYSEPRIGKGERKRNKANRWR